MVVLWCLSAARGPHVRPVAVTRYASGDDDYGGSLATGRAARPHKQAVSDVSCVAWAMASGTAARGCGRTSWSSAGNRRALDRRVTQRIPGMAGYLPR